MWMFGGGEMRVALTGHRPERLGLPEDETSKEWSRIRTWLEDTLFNLRTDNDELHVYSGMASGSDFLFAILGWLTKYTKLHCVLPCKNYNSSHYYYKEIKTNADEWIELSDEFYKGCDNVRDQYMVDHCDVLIAIWDGNKSGGVWSTIRKAQKAGKTIIYCPKEILETKG